MPSSRRRGELAVFLRRLPLAVAGAALLWFVVRPVYNPLICASAQWLVRLYEYPKAALITADGTSVTLGRIDLRAGSGQLSMSLTQITFNMVPFLALTFALRRSLADGGWRRLLIALALLAASHVVNLIFQLYFFYAFSLGPWSRANYSDLARNVIGGLRYFCDIPLTFALPLLLWVGSFPRPVFALLGIPADAPAAPRR